MGRAWTRSDTATPPLPAAQSCGVALCLCPTRGLAPTVFGGHAFTAKEKRYSCTNKGARVRPGLETRKFATLGGSAVSPPPPLVKQSTPLELATLGSWGLGLAMAGALSLASWPWGANTRTRWPIATHTESAHRPHDRTLIEPYPRPVRYEARTGGGDPTFIANQLL